MKNRYSNDERVIRSNGQVSEGRVLVIEALEALAAEGATSDDLFQLVGQAIGGENPKMSIGKILSNMDADGYIVHHRGRWYMKENEPGAIEISNGKIEISSPNGNRVQIAPLVQKRSGKVVSIFTSPREMADVVKITLVIKGQALPIPLWGDMWICYGQTTPDWDAEKETYYNVETIRLLLKNGQQHEEHPSPSDIVTIAQG